MSNALVKLPGSLAQVAASQGITLAQAWLNAEYGVLVDGSGSMDAHDAPGGKRRFTAASDELAKLQKRHEGKVAVWSFSGSHEFAFSPGGYPEYHGGGTDLAHALEQLHMVDGILRQLYVLCDGGPNSPEKALAAAAKFKQTTINAVYIGPEDDHGAQDFMRQLARACGGQYAVAEKVKELAAAVEKLMLTDGGAR